MKLREWFQKSFRMRWSGYGGQSAMGYLSQAYGWSWPWMPASRYDYVREAGHLWLNSAVMASTAWVQRNFCDARLRVCTRDEKGNKVEIRDHPMPELLRFPNRDYTGTTLWYATLLSWCCNGNSFWIRARDNRGYGVTRALYWVPHWTMSPQWPSDGSRFISHYLYTINGTHTRVEPEDVVHLRYGLDPLNSRLGLSPLAACLREVCSDNEINNYTASIMRNMGVPGLVVTPKDANVIVPFGQEDEIRARFEAAFTGDERGKPMVHTIPLDVQMPAFNPDQLAIEIMRKVPEERITAALGIPASVVGLGAGLDRSTFNNFKEARQAAWENNIAPTHTAMGEQLDQQLLAEFRDPVRSFTEWDYSEVTVLQEDINKRFERWGAAYRDGIVKRSEARAAVGLQYDSEDEVYYQDVEKETDLALARAQPRPALSGNGNGRKDQHALRESL